MRASARMVRPLVLFGLLAFLATHANAATITYSYTGTGSGTIGTTSFSSAGFEITGSGNTANRASFGGGLYIPNDSASIEIDGVGTLAFSVLTSFFVSNGAHAGPGFTAGGLVGGHELYVGPIDSQFATWDMLTSIGPVSGSTQLIGGTNATGGGTLVLNFALTTGTFTATVSPDVVPEPGVLLLLVVPGLAMLTRHIYRRTGAE